MQHTSRLSTLEIEERLQSLVHKGIIFFPTNKIIFIKRKGNCLVLKGTICTAKVKMERAEIVTKWEISAIFNWTIYFTQLFLAAFFLAFIFSNKLTLNGNSDPSFLEILGFVTIGIVMFLMPMAFFSGQKKDFIKQIEDKINANYN